MTVVQQGQVNTTAQQVPGLIVQIVPPGPAPINGVPSNIAGLVGVASWGPVGVPVFASAYNDGSARFGQMQVRKYDLMTALWNASQQGNVGAYALVRVTDGTDTAATAALGTTYVTLTAKYTGTLGNTLSATLSAGTKASTAKLTLSAPGFTSEVFDNIPGTAAALRDAIVLAVNNGNSQFRGPSALVTASAGASSTAPSLPTTVTFASGTDGATTITSSVMLGTDTAPRKGMYALRQTGASVAALVDCDDTTSYANQVAFGLSEGVYMLMVGPAGDTISNAVSAKATAGIDSYDAKIIFGDWCYINDTVNNQVRLTSPQGFFAGYFANASPQNSSLNKQMFGIVGTQRTYTGQPYSQAELLQLVQAGIDLITNPIPAGAQFGSPIGLNTSSDQALHEDSYTRLTNYIAYSINAWGGKFVGQLQGFQTYDQTRANAYAGLAQFMQNMVDQGLIDSYKVTLDKSNNPDSRVMQGWMQADVQARYKAVVRNFLVNLQGGQTTVIQRPAGS
ncbi:phage tail protein [Burkholderia ambifaria]|uniref:phage tail protein n=1 Tax=Burkholderia ambifaria TaxID=152480 RepID=UPI001B9AF4FD|nr:phage tail protein [Burkholderia ambifaria]MBR8182093.1 phage tail protein [Burkholderia ambifaria]